MEESTKKKIAAPCDSRCRLAMSEDCDCECGGKMHGADMGNMSNPAWVAKSQRLSLTRKAFRKSLNAQVKGSGTHLYRREREEFDKQYLIWKTAQENVNVQASNDEITTVHQGSELTVIKDKQFGDDVFSHVRRQNGKTEYRKNDKVITKAEVPAELGW